MAGEATKKMPIDLMSLSLLKERDMYCYEMVQEVARRSGELLVPAEAALYMSLYKLEQRGFISSERVLENSENGRGRARMRVYYHMEPTGSALRESLLEEYLRAAEGIQKFLSFKE